MPVYDGEMLTGVPFGLSRHGKVEDFNIELAGDSFGKIVAAFYRRPTFEAYLIDDLDRLVVFNFGVWRAEPFKPVNVTTVSALFGIKAKIDSATALYDKFHGEWIVLTLGDKICFLRELPGKVRKQLSIFVIFVIFFAIFVIFLTFVIFFVISSYFLQPSLFRHKNRNAINH